MKKFLWLLVALTPTWLYLLVYNLLEPEGFWQELIILGLGLYFLLGIQFVLIMSWIFFSLKEGKF